MNANSIKRKLRRPKTTWQRTVETELREMDLTWSEGKRTVEYWANRLGRIGAVLWLTRGEE